MLTLILVAERHLNEHQQCYILPSPPWHPTTMQTLMDVLSTTMKALRILPPSGGWTPLIPLLPILAARRVHTQSWGVLHSAMSYMEWNTKYTPRLTSPQFDHTMNLTSGPNSWNPLDLIDIQSPDQSIPLMPHGTNTPLHSDHTPRWEDINTLAF